VTKRLAAVCASLVFAAACTSQPAPPQAASTSSVQTSTPALPPVALPDLSGMEPSVQQQMRDRSAALTAKIENAGTPPGDLAESYGAVGNLLLAAEYRDAAEAYYLHAQALAPNDMRWPYYLGHVYRLRGELAESAASFERALQLQPNDIAALVWLGDVHLDQGKPEQADQSYTEILKTIGRKGGGPVPPPPAMPAPAQMPSAPIRNVAPAPAGAQLATLPPSASPQDEYDMAYGYVLHKDYSLAEQSFRDFLKKYPNQRLVPEAQYWLGESLFQQQRYRDAAESFLGVSTKFERSGKAPDALLRLGQSLAAMNQKEAACATLAEVGRKYPRASASVKHPAGAPRSSERPGLGLRRPSGSTSS